MPTTRASTITEPRIWRFVAPMVRSVANSRVRWAIVIDSEFAMTNEPDEERDPSERQQERPQERDELVRVRGVGRRLLAAGQDLGVRRQDLLDLADELRVGDVGLRRDGDLVELPDLLEEALCSRKVEAGKRRAADREARAELDDARDTHSLDGPFGLHTDRLPDLEVLLGRRLLVDDDLVRPRPVALDQASAD